MTTRTIKIDRYSRKGVFAAVIESPGQAPILLETEGSDTSFEAAHERARKCLIGGGTIRFCVVRLIPITGNELLLADMLRMQPDENPDQEEAF